MIVDGHAHVSATDYGNVAVLLDQLDQAGIDRAVWEQAGAQLGLLGLAIPEEYGGAGFSFAEQAIVLEELGAALYSGPYLASGVLAATGGGPAGQDEPVVASDEGGSLLGFVVVSQAHERGG